VTGCLQALLGNHQVELAERLAADRHLVFGDSEHLLEALQEFQETRAELKLLPPGEPGLFTAFLDNLMGV
jgi:hypothetical protein